MGWDCVSCEMAGRNYSCITHPSEQEEEGGGGRGGGKIGGQVMRSESTFLRKSIAFWKAPRLRKFVLLERATCREI